MLAHSMSSIMKLMISFSFYILNHEVDDIFLFVVRILQLSSNIVERYILRQIKLQALLIIFGLNLVDLFSTCLRQPGNRHKAKILIAIT